MMIHGEIEAAIERLRKLSHGARTYTALEVVRAVIPDGLWTDGLIDLLEQADPDTHMELPRDADGVPIHIGDELWCYGGYPNGGVYCMAINGRNAILVAEVGMSYKDMLLWDPKNCRHYHKPTVEDVLREMFEKAVGFSDAHTTVALNAIAEYADKLRELLVDAVEVADDYYCCVGVKDDLDAIKDEMKELGIEVGE